METHGDLKEKEIEVEARSSFMVWRFAFYYNRKRSPGPLLVRIRLSC